MAHKHSGPGFATPLQAMREGPREKLMYVILVSYDGKQPDALGTVDIDAKSDTFCQVVHTLPMPYLRDELHHAGWNVCSSCCYDASMKRRYLILPGNLSSRIYIIDTIEPREPKIHKVIEPEEIKGKWNLSAPHTVHCLPNGQVMISMLGDGKLDAPGGFLLLDSNFNIVGRWNEKDEAKMSANHGFWYQVAHNVLVSSEFTAPKHYYYGMNVGKLDMSLMSLGQGLNFWNWREKTHMKRVDLGMNAKVLVGARFMHDPLSTHGFVVSVIGSSIWHWYKDNSGEWHVEKAAQMESVAVPHLPDAPPTAFPADLVISLDDRFMYVSNWLRGDICQYDITNPFRIHMVSRVQCAPGHANTGVDSARSEIASLRGGPHMMQLSLDGERLYVTNSFLSTWDDQFYPNLGPKGFWMICIQCDTKQGGMKIDENFLVKFDNLEGHSYRAHEMRYPGGDCTSDIWVATEATEATDPDVKPVM